MTPEHLRTFLNGEDVVYEEKQLPHGIQFRCSGGEIFVVYSTGKLVVQGGITELSKRVEALPPSRGPAGPPSAVAPAPGSPAGTKLRGHIFIVYGHDTTARNDLELVIRRMGLEPIVLQNLPASGDMVIEKLEHYIGEHGTAGFACALLTPDDEGHKAGMAAEKKYRARQNVVLELGMVLARLGRKRVAILMKESVEAPSDISGLLYIPFKERVEEVTIKLLQDLVAAGFTCETGSL